MTSGNIQLGPDPDRILDALQGPLSVDPDAPQRAVEEMSKELVRNGYLHEGPDPVLVAELLDGPEEESLQADEAAGKENRT